MPHRGLRNRLPAPRTGLPPDLRAAALRRPGVDGYARVLSAPVSHLGEATQPLGGGDYASGLAAPRLARTLAAGLLVLAGPEGAGRQSAFTSRQPVLCLRNGVLPVKHVDRRALASGHTRTGVGIGCLFLHALDIVGANRCADAGERPGVWLAIRGRSAGAYYVGQPGKLHGDRGGVAPVPGGQGSGTRAGLAQDGTCVPGGTVPRRGGRDRPGRELDRRTPIPPAAGAPGPIQHRPTW